MYDLKLLKLKKTVLTTEKKFVNQKTNLQIIVNYLENTDVSLKKNLSI